MEELRVKKNNYINTSIKLVVIVIPIYKECLTQYEIISLSKAIEIFHSRKIIFIAPEGLNVNCYYEIIRDLHKEYNFKYFSNSFFYGVEGYNHLMLSLDFYNEFSDYKFMLIYQLDAYVFTDELDFWCGLGYDYIGAPWVIKQNNVLKIENFAGNGGFSLRKVSMFIKTLEINKKIVLNPLQIISEYSKKGFKCLFPKIPLIIVRIFGYRNNTKFYINSNTQKEDVFWAYCASKINMKFKVMKGTDAIGFAFEKYPSYLYNVNKKLPFGCHAWNKYECDFWKEYIQFKN